MAGRIAVLAAFAWVLVALPAEAARRVEVPNRLDIPLLDGDRKPLSLADTRKAILAAARMRDWQVKTDEPGLIRLEYAYRRGNAGAVVEVPYKAGSYSIIYANSYGLAARETSMGVSIKSGYLQWVRNLAHDIDMAGMRSVDPQTEAQRPQESADDPDDKEPSK